MRDKMKQATQETVEKIVDLLSHGLISGLGKPEQGNMCAEAAVCYALGIPHGDDPVCVSRAIRQFVITLNDASWSSPQARAEGMKRLTIIQLNSAGTIDDKEFAKRILEMAIRKTVPFALREAAKVHPDQYHKDALEAAAKQCEGEGTTNVTDAATAARYVARYAATAARYVARYVARYAADAAAAKAADAAAKAADAAYAADAANTDGDNFLSATAEDVVQILVSMNAPAIDWLALAPIQAIAA